MGPPDLSYSQQFLINLKGYKNDRSYNWWSSHGQTLYKIHRTHAFIVVHFSLKSEYNQRHTECKGCMTHPNNRRQRTAPYYMNAVTVNCALHTKPVGLVCVALFWCNSNCVLVQGVLENIYVPVFYQHSKQHLPDDPFRAMVLIAVWDVFHYDFLYSSNK